MSGDAKILVFSDSATVAENLEQTLRYVSVGQDIRVTSSEAAARTLLDAAQFDLVFAHSTAGALAAAGFLDDVWRKSPQTSRFIVSETMLNSDALVRCVLGAHQFIATPVEPAPLREALERSEAIKRFVRNEKIQPLVSRMRTLPSRPSLYLEVMRELRSPAASAAAVGELVSRDFAISTKLIQVANSAFFGREQQVSDPAAAVLLLGLEMTGALVLSIEAFARFDKVKPLYFSIDRVWKHSQSIADLSKKICEIVGTDADTKAQAYTAGLLHDIGKLAFAQNFEQDYQRSLKEAEETRTPVHEMEHKVFGASHAEAGAYLLALWGLPLPIVGAVADHHAHTGELEAPFSATTALHLAEQIACAPERFDEIVSGYPYALGLFPCLEELRRLFNAPASAKGKDAPAPPAPEPESALAEAPEPAPVNRLEPVEEPVLAAEPSSRRPRKKLYLALAALFAFFALFDYAFLRKGRLEKAVSQAPPAAAAEASQAAALSPSASAQPQTPAAVAETPELKLQAIMYSHERSSLLMNGKILHVGDSVAGWLVVGIDPTEVTVQSGGQRRVLALK